MLIIATLEAKFSSTDHFFSNKLNKKIGPEPKFPWQMITTDGETKRGSVVTPRFYLVDTPTDAERKKK